MTSSSILAGIRSRQITGGRVNPRRHLLQIGAHWLVYVALLGAVPFLVLGLAGIHPNVLLYDFKGGLYDAGVAILHGRSPYQPGFLAHQAAIMHAGGIAIGETVGKTFSIPVYPAPANVAIVPLSLLPLWLAGAIYTLASIAALVQAVWLLGVRDWRCFALALLSWPFIYGLYLGALGPFLLLGVAVVWRYRDRVWAPAIAIASIVVAKIFPWPVAAWLFMTRRWKAFALMVAIGLLTTFGAWALIGFHGIAQYPQMLSDVSFIQERRAVSLVAVLLAAGCSPTVASVLALLGAGVLLAGAWHVLRRPDGQRRALALAVIAALTGTPIVWDHYMVLLFVPIALISPAFSALWLIPLATPVIVTTSVLLVPMGSHASAGAPDTLRTAAVWLAFEAFLAIRVAFPEHLAAFRARARGEHRLAVSAATHTFV
jgi:hypothetical protein